MIDASFWSVRGVPSLEEVLDLILDYHHALGKRREDWRDLLDRVAAKMDESGKAYGEGMKTRRGPRPAARGPRGKGIQVDQSTLPVHPRATARLAALWSEEASAT